MILGELRTPLKELNFDALCRLWRNKKDRVNSFTYYKLILNAFEIRDETMLSEYETVFERVG